MRPTLDAAELSYLLQLGMVLEKVTPVLSRFIKEVQIIGIHDEGDLHLQLALPLPNPDEWSYPEQTSHGGLHE